MVYLYNTLTLTKEKFKPLVRGQVRIYSCGPTVYDFPHIGNMRAYVFSDVLRRLFEYHNYKVIQVINITDVGHLLVEDGNISQDKIENSARIQRKTVKEIIDFYTKVFLRYLNLLQIKKPTYMPFASQHISEQIKIIQILEKKGYTYLTDEGVYFDTSKLKIYGSFGGIDLTKEGVSRLEKSSFKKNQFDFALWRFSKPQEKRQQEWQSPWGIGFPGWHTECLAMDKKYLGLPFDIHTGGVDHISVHHQNEIAQAESAFGVNPARYWMHSEFVVVNEEKMSKSLKNFLTLDDIIKKGFEPLSLRLLYLQAHYRQKINFTFEALKAAQNSLQNLYRFMKKLSFIGSFTKSKAEKQIDLGIKTAVSSYKNIFQKSIDDDLNTPKALAGLFDFITEIEKKLTAGLLNFNEAKLIKGTILKTDKVFGLFTKQETIYSLPAEIEKILSQREKLRFAGNYEKADKIRLKLLKQGWHIEDTKYGQFAYRS